MSDSNNNNSGGFAKTTDFKWFGIGVLIFILIGLILPTPDSMLAKAKDLFGADPSADVNLKANTYSTHDCIASHVRSVLCH